MRKSPPNEPGYYLFFGQRLGSDLGSHSARLPEPELVRVVRGSAGNLVLIGADRLLFPANATGLWIALDVEDLQERAYDFLVSRALEDLYPHFRRSLYDQNKEGFMKWLAAKNPLLGEEGMETLAFKAEMTGLLET